jgi:hypothetical protein
VRAPTGARMPWAVDEVLLKKPALPSQSGIDSRGGMQDWSIGEHPAGVGIVFVDCDQQGNAIHAQTAVNVWRFGEMPPMLRPPLKVGDVGRAVRLLPLTMQRH